MTAMLKVDGCVARALELSIEDLSALPAAEQIDDVSRIDERRRGCAIRLRAISEVAQPLPEATHVTLHASADDFAASIPLDDLGDAGVLIYQIDGAPLAVRDGGPFRFLIENAAACRTAELDACANVKFVDRVEFTSGPGRDTRDSGGAKDRN